MNAAVSRRMMGAKSLLISALCLSGCTALPNTGENDLATDAERGVLAFYVEDNRADLTFAFGRYDAKRGSVDERFSAGFAVEAQAAPGRRLVAKTVPAGLYAIVRSERAMNWRLCHHASTEAVEIAPGRISFLGVLDASPLHDAIERKSAENEDGPIQVFGAHHENRTYFSGLPSPEFVLPPSEAERERLRDEVAAALADVGAPVLMVEAQDAAFGVGFEPFSDRLVCAGPVPLARTKMGPDAQ